MAVSTITIEVIALDSLPGRQLSSQMPLYGLPEAARIVPQTICSLRICFLHHQQLTSERLSQWYSIFLSSMPRTNFS
jgi:hypothetical protein